MSVPFACTQEGIQIAGVPSNLYTVNLVTGLETLVGAVTPSATYNAIGYNILDNYIYGWQYNDFKVVKISADATADILPDVPDLPNAEYNVGDVTLNGYLYLYERTGTRFYVIDVNQSRSTYLRLVDPANYFQVQTSNFGVAIAPQNIADWAFNPIDGQLYSVETDTGIVLIINPVTGNVSSLTTTGLALASYGAVFFDVQGHLYALNNANGDIYKITITATDANGVLFSTAAASANNDGARCPLAQLDLISAVKSVDLTQAILGDRLTYTIVITNNSATTACSNVIFVDPIPNGTTYVGGSATVNGLPAVGDPATGIIIGTIPVGESRTVQYEVDISTTTLPYPNPIPNTATIAYNEGLPIESNTVYTRVLFPERGILFI